MAATKKLQNVDRENINLLTKKGQERIGELHNTTAYYEQHCSINDYLKSLTASPLTAGDCNVFVEYRGKGHESHVHTIILKNRHLYIDRHSLPHDLSYWKKYNSLENTDAIVITDCKVRHGNTAGNRVILLLDADEKGWRSSEAANLFGKDGHPLVSFNCVGQMFGDRNEAIKKLTNGQLILLDYTPEERLPLSAEEKKVRKEKRKKLTPPKPGFSYVGTSWHRSGSCLFKDTKTEKCYIFGQDEGSYFGCELPKTVKTIAEAFEVLMPEAVRGKQFQRQGEWFIIAVDEKDVPDMKDCVLQFNTEYNGNNPVCLPKDDPNSNEHGIESKDGRVSKDGLFVNGGSLSHPEHADVEFDGWVTFHRNTAIRSVSQQGVD
jgi:hypothetical protein